MSHADQMIIAAIRIDKMGSMYRQSVQRINSAPSMIAAELTASPSMWMNAARIFRSCLSRFSPSITTPFRTSAIAATISMMAESIGTGCSNRSTAS